MAAAGIRAAAIALLAAAAVLQTANAATIEECATVQTCTVNGASKVCDVRVEKCPPCVFPRADKFDCFEYDAEARAAASCPFVSATTNYVDCSTAENWAKWNTPAAANATANGTRSASSSSSSGSSSSAGARSPSAGDNASVTTTDAESASSSSDVALYAGIGVGALVVLLVIVALWRRRRQRDRRDTVARHMARSSNKRVKTKHEEAFGSGLNGSVGPGYTNGLDTSKGGGGSYHHHDVLSVDGMLGDAPVTPVVLLETGAYGTGKTGPSANANGFTSVNDLLTQDVSIRITTSANVFDEYLRMKQEMNYDGDDDDARSDDAMSEMSDLDSDTMSLKYSLESATSTAVGGGALPRHNGGLSITDSEFEEHMENRGESECYSEMSYNDEKYSFSEDDDLSNEFARSRLANSHNGNAIGGGGIGSHVVPDREVEI